MTLRHLRFFNICCVLSFELGLVKPSWSALIAR